MVVVIDKLDLATAACDEVRESSRFRRMMRDVILQVGNQLNAGSARGAAVGFKLASLGALNISGFDGTPLMRFIIENLMKAQSPVRCVLIVRLVLDVGLTSTSASFFTSTRSFLTCRVS